MHAGSINLNRLDSLASRAASSMGRAAMTSVDVRDRTESGAAPRPNLEGPYYSKHELRPGGNLA